MSDFRFSFNILDIGSREEFAETCRRGERYGYDTVFAADHLGSVAPFTAMVAAADATERLRVGTLVLNAAFWNPALLAREVVTTDLLTGGRLELGLGSGHMKWEFDEAGIAWEPFGERADRLEATIRELGRLFAADGYPQQAATREAMGLRVHRPVQGHGFDGAGPPLIVGGTGDRILKIAAEHADIVSVAGAFRSRASRPAPSASAPPTRRPSASGTRASAPASGPARSSGTYSSSSCWRPMTAGPPPERSWSGTDR